jgi:hypothetical protein
MMTQTTALSPSALSYSEIACAECPFFNNYHDARGRGLCRVFDIVARVHHRATQDCAGEIKKLQLSTYTVAVQLITEAVEDNGEGYPVPVGESIINLVVPQLNEESVEKALATHKSLEGYKVMSFWQPVYDDDII